MSRSNTATAVTPGYIEPTDEMWLSGGSKVGDTLSVEGSGGWHAGGEPISLLYQWERDGQPITGATAATYTVVAADKGHWIRAKVTATAPGYWPNAQTSLRNDIVDADTDKDGEVNPGGQPIVPVPEEEPTAPAPGEQAPGEQAPASAPAPAHLEQTPARQASVVKPTTRNALARNYVPAQTGGGYVQPQAAGQARSLIADAAAKKTYRSALSARVSMWRGLRRGYAKVSITGARVTAGAGTTCNRDPARPGADKRHRRSGRRLYSDARPC